VDDRPNRIFKYPFANQHALKATNYAIQKPSTCRRLNIISLQVLGRCCAIFTLRDQLVKHATKTFAVG